MLTMMAFIILLPINGMDWKTKKVNKVASNETANPFANQFCLKKVKQYNNAQRAPQNTCLYKNNLSI